MESLFKEMTGLGTTRDPGNANAALQHLRRNLHPPVFTCEVGNECRPASSQQGGSWYDWTAFVEKCDGDSTIDSVTFDLHPSFTPKSVTVRAPPFAISRRGWGAFPLRITIQLRCGERFSVAHKLDLSPGRRVVTSHEFQLGKAPNDKLRRMEGVEHTTAHGHLAPHHWIAPVMVTECDEDARPGYQTMKAHEYLDDPEVLREKVRLLASLLDRAKCAVLYTGAGISTASGIGDYATKAKATVAKKNQNRLSSLSGLNAQPTQAHRVLTALHHAGKISHWVQQNHDGLPQKAGFPQHCLNEIHGAWFDPSNPVVPMSGTLRSDLCDTLFEYETKTDLSIAMGTSLCGMNADRMVTTPARKFLRNRKGKQECLGSVIIGLQQTQCDHSCSLRIFSRIDDVMILLANEMKLHVPTETPAYKCDDSVQLSRDLFHVPYDTRGKRTNQGKSTWDLRDGATVVVNGGPGNGFKGTVRGKTNDGHYRISLPCIREGSPDHGKGSVTYLLGSWWVQQAVEGLATTLPVVNESGAT